MTKAEQIIEFQKRMETELGPGMYIVCLQSKQGYDGGPYVVKSALAQKDRLIARLARANDIAVACGLSPASEEVCSIRMPFLDQFISPSGAPVWTLRNAAVQAFMAQPVGTMLVWIDGDVAWNESTIETLRWDMANHPEFGMMGALVCTRTFERLPCIYRWNSELRCFPRIDLSETELPEDGILEIDGLGCGFTAVRRTVYEQLQPVKNGYYWQVYNLSEDLFFCSIARDQIQLRTAVNVNNVAPHVGLAEFDWHQASDVKMQVWGQLLDSLKQHLDGYVASGAYPSVLTTVFPDQRGMPTMFGDPRYDASLKAILEHHDQAVRQQIMQEIQTDGNPAETPIFQR